MNTCITRWVEFDAGHRVPRHNGKCRSPHGHRYRVGVTVEGPIRDHGMILDFGIVADALRSEVHDHYDHAFIVQSADLAMREALGVDPSWKTVVMSEAPTAENLASEIAARLLAPLIAHDVHVMAVEVWETPNSVARWEAL